MSGINGADVSTPTTDVVEAIRRNVITFASAIVGTSAVSNYDAYVSIIAPGETMTTQNDMAKMSASGLTVAGIWRACGLYNSQLNAPYVIGTSLSRLVAIAQACGGYQKYTQGMLPIPGDMVLLGTEEHAYTVISVENQGNGNAIIRSVDGGEQNGDNSSVQGADCDAILACTHTWTNGQDTDAYYTRPIQAIIDVTKVITSAQMPLAGFVQPAPPGTLGVDCMTAITSRVAWAIAPQNYAFCIRYISPNESSVAALTRDEARGILDAGMALILTQKVNASTLDFSSSLGTEHGQAAAQSAVTIGIPMCANIGIALDGIPSSTNATNLLNYYEAWYNAVYNAGFLPALCVGPTEILTGAQLYKDLGFCHYWQSAGATITPSPRGYQLVAGTTVTIGEVQMNAVTAQNDAGNGLPQGPGQAQWLIANPVNPNS